MSSTVAPCESGHYCQDGTCLLQVCEADTVFCDGEVAKVCNANGSAVASEEDCQGKQQLCFNGSCIDTQCPPNEEFCADETTVGTCSADGLSFQSDSCASQHSCLYGKCEPWLCEPAQAVCDGTIAATCDDLGLGFVEGGTDCDLLGKLCLEGQCLECQPQCDAMQCGSDGCGGDCGDCSDLDQLFCASAVCEDGSCKLTVGDFFCVVEGICVPSGTENPAKPCEKCQPLKSQTGWSFVENDIPCGNGLSCYNGVCCNYDCHAKQCGADGCGGVCGVCPDTVECSKDLCSICEDGNQVDWDGCTNGELTEFLVHTTTSGGPKGSQDRHLRGRFFCIRVGERPAGR